MGISDGQSYELLVTGSEEPRDESKIPNAEMEIGNTGVRELWIFEASASAKRSTYGSC